MTKKCECGTEIVGRQDKKFCSDKCRYAFRNSKLNRAQRHAWRLKTLYGITKDEYNYFMVMQSDRCAVCLTDEKGKNQHGTNDFWCVDHDHTTGKVRGLLCDNCNRGIGLLGDDADNLLSASQYLEAHYA